MNIHFKPVTRDNWEEALALKISDHQRDFVPTVAVSLAKVFIKPDGENVEYLPFAIYDKDQMVGFIMHAYEETTTNMYWINGFFIDQAFQQKGYGKRAMIEMMTWIENRFPQCQEIRLTVHKNNIVARRLYEHLGFISIDMSVGDEEIMKKERLR
ncbi:GNAT family N-acetyltransferase [Heyndrickxia sporothermodurans]|uniref:GNAT family N-acetyltransferase n=1 Tax=Heyndrickxia sporothermodurans TaxID=46224 RepID=A0AB37HJE6_9BACI|nr:GNAT family N-acetyltransferase [Heyndrickxia sporothermodurans]MBL5768044.1 GNAT family N-acetyltransferase [Heyndrickxia sporothermodurans]MBL5771639.1 GNAT family N-acetyltransferase [Heyndrickxia sporothermodurans]MBL5778736.1 GNAT family N-acetyltransferase [Heyndrickxia sporothermodurans]MBL5782395.1 GNAT family N-acetyltransferase [Heyndrickxia sporothermodurans]MBL5785925.1 GNAT family N-acetyltransferase [Heyndrickxia sporothermodurans]